MPACEHRDKCEQRRGLPALKAHPLLEEESREGYEHPPRGQQQLWVQEALDHQRVRLHEKLEHLRAQVDSDRLEQEMVIISNRADVDEELDRLAAHISEIRRVLKSQEAIGRRLDFLMQELNREANTLGSKSIAGVTTQASVELKVLIEQMREQIQNLE